jgi:hypothetical protein
MIERKLSKTQVRIFVALSQQRAELQQQFQEIVEAEREQIEMLRKQYGLPEGEYQIRQEQNGDVIMFMQPEDKPADAEDGKAEAGEKK